MFYETGSYLLAFILFAMTLALGKGMMCNGPGAKTTCASKL
jgi:hypothetical protein